MVVSAVSIFSCLMACMAVPIIAQSSTNPMEVVAMLVLIPTLIISILASTPFIYFYRKIVFENLNMIDQLNKDPLTGLLNRHAFYPKFTSYLKELQEEKKAYALLMVDIDDFKVINDTYGHILGDQVIKHTGTIIGQHTGTKNLSCRFGGEEFLIFIQDTTLIEANSLSENMRHVLDTRISFNETQIDITASVGMVFSESSTIHPETLIAEADRKMYDAKGNGKNQLAHKIISQASS